MTRKEKLSKIKQALEKLLLTYSQVTTDKGVIYWDGDEEYSVNTNVYYEDENGEKMPLEAGVYETEQGFKLSVEGGHIVSIEEPKEDTKMEEIEPAPVVEEPQVEQVEQVEAETKQEEEVKEDPVDEKDNTIVELNGKISEKDNKIAELEARIKELEEQPAAKSPAQEYENITKMEKTGNKAMDNLRSMISAGKY